MYLRDKFVVRRSILVSDGIGGFSESLSDCRSDVKCYLRKTTGEELVEFAKKGKFATHKLYCSDIDITVSDIISVRQFGETISNTFEIESIDQRRDLSTGHKKQMHIYLYTRE